MAHSRIARRDQSEHAAVGTGAQAELVDGGFQELVGFFFNSAIALDVFSTHLSVGMDCSFVEALELDGARAVHSLANGSGRLPRFFAGKFLITQGRDFDLNIDPV